MSRKIGVLGAGAWGTALALLAARTGAEVTLWARDPAVASEIERTRENRTRLPGVALPQDVHVTARIDDLVDGRPLLAAMPLAYLTPILTTVADRLPADTAWVICAKGIDPERLLRPSEMVAKLAPHLSIGTLSGPSFAIEVAQGLPAAVALASADEQLTRTILDRLGQPTFRLYPTDDVVGVEIGGAVKNVLAIAAGTASGRALGRNAGAALITRGLAEVTRLALALGARAETIAGLACLGDLVLTCGGGPSRNFAFGHALGAGASVAEAFQQAGGVVEGVPTATAVARVAQRHRVDMPIVAAVDAVMRGAVPVGAAIDGLLARPLRLS